MKRIFILLLLVSLILGACNTNKKKIQEIEKMEKALVDTVSGKFDKATAIALIKLYEDFALENPKDTLTPTYLFKTAELQLNTATPQQAIATLDRIIRDFPEYRKLPESYFLKGFVYENNLNDLNNAKKSYQEFLKKFPAHYFADDAQALLDNLGKSPEEVIREFEAKNQAGKQKP